MQEYVSQNKQLTLQLAEASSENSRTVKNMQQLEQQLAAAKQVASGSSGGVTAGDEAAAQIVQLQADLSASHATIARLEQELTGHQYKVEVSLVLCLLLRGIVI
jgi:chromosome segregation ATPase